MMKTKADIKKSGAHQGVRFSLHLEGDMETLVELERLLGLRDHFGGRGVPKAQWKLWRAAYLLLLVMFLANIPELVARAFSG